MRALIFSLSLLFFAAAPVHSQELVQDEVSLWKAQVVEVLSSEVRNIPGTDTPSIYQSIRVEVLEGPHGGEELVLENDFLSLEKGDVFYLRHAVDGLTGDETYSVSEPYRLLALAWLGVVFLVCLFVFGGKQGARGLAALVASLFFIVYLLLPGILGGYPPVLVALGVSSIIIIAGSYITHGWNRSTHAAVAGMLATIAVTGLLAYVTIRAARLSGYSSEEAVYLNFSTQGSIDFVGLLLGSLLIGLLGVLYDAAISQAIAVEELSGVGSHLTRREIFSRGLRIGREHIGALVNTLAIAYAGVSLPLLLYLASVPGQSLLVTLNQEMFATELVRMLVGSIGIVLAVPITTAIAVQMLYGKVPPRSGEGHGHRH